ncbi:MAG TPA: hypothetical protein VL307_04655 [Chitinophagaceae bacterium]|nr:hypothetical protein [Chitinophagaceae bacterium]
MRRYGYLLLTGLFFLGGCNEFQQAVKDAKKEIPPPPKDNYIVLVDLSDRILFNNQQQVPKDIAVINAVYDIFTARLNSKDPTHLYYSLHDKLKVLIAPQRTTPKSLYDRVGSLRIDLSAEQPDKKSSAVEETAKTFNKTLPDIYKQAVIGNNSTAYSGADIWKYFNEDLTDDLEKDAQNTLFIITDGYMDLEKADERPAQNNRYASCSQIINTLKKFPDWEAKFTAGDYGLLSVPKKFPSLKVLVLQVNPKEDWNGEYTLITKIWGKWFAEMGISNYRFVKDDNVNEVKESMEKFMDVKAAGKIALLPWTKIDSVDSSLVPAIIEEKQRNIAAAPPTLVAPLEKTPAAVTSNAIAQPAVKQVRSINSDAPDESDAGILTGKKKDRGPLKKTSAKEDDILADGNPADGFNTGIKKESKKNPLTAAGRSKQ